MTWFFLILQNGLGVVVIAERIIRTVDGNGNGLVKDITVSTNESWNLSKLVELEVVGWGFVACSSSNDLKVNVVGLGNSPDGDGAGVALNICQYSVTAVLTCREL